VAFAVACVGLGLLVAYLGAVLAQREDMDRAILERASELLRHHDAGGREGLVQGISALEGNAQDNAWMYSYWSVATRTVWAGNMQPPRGDEIGEQPGSFWIEDRRVRGVSYPLSGGDAVVVGRDVTGRSAFERRLLIASISAGAVVLVLSIGAGLFVSRRLVGRVERMNHTVVSILRGMKSERVSCRPDGDEFDELARHFNELLDEKERLVAQVREVTDNIAHDLRTPLARVRHQLEAALARPRADAADAETLQAALAETNGLLETFHSLLSIAQIEGGTLREAMTSVDLAQVAGDAVELYEPAAEEAGHELALDATAQTLVEGNRHLLSQALTNLIDNAIKFSPPKGAIEVSVRRTDAGPELRVADHGPGIPAEECERVLQRFTRLDASREKPGTGLGLSLVAAVAHLHGASLHLTDNAPGLVATLRFPAPE